jgi:hypothetical protein
VPIRLMVKGSGLLRYSRHLLLEGQAEAEVPHLAEEEAAGPQPREAGAEEKLTGQQERPLQLTARSWRQHRSIAGTLGRS